jgi:hypothetical protein
LFDAVHGVFRDTATVAARAFFPSAMPHSATCARTAFRGWPASQGPALSRGGTHQLGFPRRRHLVGVAGSPSTGSGQACRWRARRDLGVCDRAPENPAPASASVSKPVLLLIGKTSQTPP